MVLPGLRSTNDMGVDGRPKNWREGLLLLSPRNNAPLFSLTAAMSERSTDDPEYYWWEEDVDLLTYKLNDATGMTNAETAFIVDEFALRLKPGDLLRVDRTGEILRVTANPTVDTGFTASRGAANTAAAAMLDDDVILYIGSAYEEGAAKVIGTSFNPQKVYNLTQIFRDPVEWTRTALATRLRYTTSIQKEDRRRILHKHSVGIERAMWLGAKYETTLNGQPLRTMGGLLSFIPASNVQTVVGAGGALDADELFSYFPRIFAYGDSEKTAFTSLKVMSILGEVVRKNSQYQWGPNEKEYGMRVKRLFSPAGTLTLMEHPLFGQAGGFLADSFFAIDTSKFKYVYLQDADTKLLKDRETPGTDGKTEEYLTECGLEVHSPKTMFQLKGILSAAADTP